MAESDFSKELADITDSKDKGSSFYEELLKKNEVMKVKKEQDVKLKTRASAGFDMSVTEYTAEGRRAD